MNSLSRNSRTSPKNNNSNMNSLNTRNLDNFIKTLKGSLKNENIKNLKYKNTILNNGTSVVEFIIEKVENKNRPRYFLSIGGNNFAPLCEALCKELYFVFQSLYKYVFGHYSPTKIAQHDEEYFSIRIRKLLRTKNILRNNKYKGYITSDLILDTMNW